MINKKQSRRHPGLYALLFLLIVKVHFTPLYAQVASAADSPSLKAFEGYYKFQFDGKDVYIEITTRENGLTLKQLWDGEVIRFARKSALEFKAVSADFPMKFTKAADGTITHVLAFDRDLWTRANDYKPVEIKEVKLSVAQLKALEGYYQLRSNKNYIQFFVQDNRLMAKQLWDEKLHQMIAESDLDFRSKEAGLPVKFVKDSKGLITQAVANQTEIMDKVNGYKPAEKKVVKLSEEQLKAVSGYYQSPRNQNGYVQVAASAGGIVVRQMWDGKEKLLTPESPLTFSAGDYEVVFSKDPDGAVTQLLAFGKDVWKKVNDYKPDEK